MRHPRVIITDLGLALPRAGSPAGTLGRLSQRLTRPGTPADANNRPQASYISPPWPAA
jgi:hypothetical protein